MPRTSPPLQSSTNSLVTSAAAQVHRFFLKHMLVHGYCTWPVGACCTACSTWVAWAWEKPVACTCKHRLAAAVIVTVHVTQAMQLRQVLYLPSSITPALLPKSTRHRREVGAGTIGPAASSLHHLPHSDILTWPPHLPWGRLHLPQLHP